MNSVVADFCQSRGIVHRVSPAYQPKSNGRIENANLHLKNVTTALMTDLAIPADLWPEVLQYGTAYLLNRRPRRINGVYQIPSATSDASAGHRSIRMQHIVMTPWCQ